MSKLVSKFKNIGWHYVSLVTLIVFVAFGIFHLSKCRLVAKHQSLNIESPLKKNASIIERKNFIRQMMKHAWNGYVNYAWGYNEVKPLAMLPHNNGVFGSQKLGATIVDTLDTLLIMELNEEFEKGRNWVSKHLSFASAVGRYSVFETNIRFVGGLLSCYALTNDTMFLTKAKEIAMKLVFAFKSKSGIPYSHVYPDTSSSSPGSLVVLSEIGTLHLEFIYLSDLTKNSTFREKVFDIRNAVRYTKIAGGLYPNKINVNTPLYSSTDGTVSLGGGGDSFYEYLLKAWIQSNYQDEDAKSLYFDAVQAVRKYLLKFSRNGLLYLPNAEFEGSHITGTNTQMEHLTCFAGGMFALGAQRLDDDQKAKHMNIAAQLTQTCHESYARSATKLGPESMLFDEHDEVTSRFNGDSRYLQRPELVESYFYMWRFTKDPKYREWAWQVVSALEKNCKVKGGYTGLHNVYQVDGVRDDVQQSFFLAETLKYLYLIFSDELLPLDKWVFNTEAHPLPILGKNKAYSNVNFTKIIPKPLNYYTP